MGVNSHGLSVLWQYVDNGERGLGVPTNVIIREMLAQKSLSDALSFLKRVPRMIPNNFILTDSDLTVNVEVSPSHFSPLYVPHGFVVHTNHFLFDQDMQDHDVGLKSSSTSVQRERAFRAMVKARDGRAMHTGDLEGMLHTHPVFRDGKNGTDTHTLVSMVFNTSARSMSIWFKGDPNGAFRSYRLNSQRPTSVLALYT